MTARSMAFVGVSQRRVLGACEYARMASSSSIRRPAGLKGFLSRIRFGAVAWWRVHRGDLAKYAIISVVVGVALLLGVMVWDARLADRQNDLATTIAERQDQLATTIAERQDQLAQDLANQAEVLENTRFVRQIATTKGNTPKTFAIINLSGAQLMGLSLPCTDVRQRVGCADFRDADLREANLTSTDLGGADLSLADLRKALLSDSDFSGAELLDADLSGVVPGGVHLGPSIFQGAHMRRTRLIQARLPMADFRKATLLYARANEADLSGGDFRNAYLKGTYFKRADLRYANFSGANMVPDGDMVSVDLRSADLRGANFTGADLRRAVLTDVCFDDTTKWGSNTPPASSSC